MIEGAVAVHRIAAGPWDQSCYVVSTPGGDAVVVDPGGGPDRIVEHVASERLRVHSVLATHGHYDHVGALAEVVEAYDVPFGIHSAELRALSRVNLCRFVFHGLGPVELPPIGLDLAAVDNLRFGELEIAVVHTPGHSPGGVCLEAGGVLLTGDTLMATHAGDTDTRESEPAKLRASVQRLARTYPPEMAIYPGHGRPGRLADAAADAARTLEPRG
jgi:hydroxyacylglutathione hydrolase